MRGARRRRTFWIGCSLAFLVTVNALQGSAAPPPSSLWERALAEVEAGNWQEAAKILEALDKNTFPLSGQRRVSFLLGYALVRLERFEAAIPHLEEATLNPVLADYALYLLARSRWESGKREQATSTLVRLLKEQPDSLLAEKARSELAREYTALKAFEQAEAAYWDYLSKFPRSPNRNAALLALAEVYLALERWNEAEEVLRQLWLKDPASQEAKRAEVLLAKLPSPKPFTDEERFGRAVILHRAGLYRQAIRELQPFVEGPSPHTGQARLLTGIGQFQLRDYQRAIEALAPFTDEASPLAPEALYWLGKSFDRLGEQEKALAAWERLVTAFPKSPWADNALYLTALAAEEGGKPEEALKGYEKFLDEFPESELFEAALWKRGWLAFKRKAYQEALDDFQDLTKRPGSPFKDQALYWRGKAWERLGDLKEAAKAYRELLLNSHNNYYAKLARERLKAIEPKEEKPPFAFSTARAGLSVPPPSPRPHLAKARELRALNLKEEAVQEYWELAMTALEDLGLLAEAVAFFEQAGRPDKALWIAKRILRPLYLQQKTEPLPGYWTLLFPLGYFDLVKEKASAADLDPYLVLAIIREESAFRKNAVSRAGARGLMQLLPKTAEEVAKALKLDGFSSDQLETPAINIALGTWYFAQLLQEFGDLALALAAYNAGPQQVRQWLTRLGPLPAEEFIEEIPFLETWQYVKRVLGSYDRYQALYARETR